MFDLEDKKKFSGDKYSFEILFAKGINISWKIFFLSLVFFVFWMIGHSKEDIIVSNSSAFSKAFFFLNPNIFHKLYFERKLISFLKGSVTLSSLMFLICHFFSFFSFVGIVIYCLRLFFISYHTCVRPFHYISCLGLFPIIGVFLITWFIFKIFIFRFETKRYGNSRFSKDFEKEEFGDPILEGNEDFLVNRDVRVFFGRIHFEKLFLQEKKDFLSVVYEKLKSLLS